MPKHSACNLGSINLSEFVQNPFTAEARFDYNDFITVVHTAVRGLDQVIDENLNNHALPEQKEMAMNYRNIGLGIMGLHDCLIKMGITYGTNDSIYFIDGIMHTMFREAVKESNYLAEKKGTFPNYSPSLFDSDIIKNHFIDNEIKELKVHGMRNCSLLSIAPTGSLGTMLNISTGCEPLFALYYNRKTESLNDGEDKYYKVYTGIAEEYMNSHSGEELPSYFNCSKDIGWKDRIKMQSCLQDHVDTAISSTINLPNETTVEEIEQLYLYAWKHQLKGITIFRDGCKRMGILTTGEADTETEDIKENQLQRGEIIDCSDELIGKKRKLTTGCGSLHCQAWFDPNTGDLQEVFFCKGSTGGCLNFMNGLSRMISLACRAGVSIFDIKDQLDSTGVCPSYATRTAKKHDTSRGTCCPNTIGNALVEMWKETQKEINGEDKPEQPKTKKTATKAKIESVSNQDNKENSTKCPVCGEPLRFEGGCNSCPNCGFSKCD